MIHDWRNLEDQNRSRVIAVNSLSGIVEYDIRDHITIEQFFYPVRPRQPVRTVFRILSSILTICTALSARSSPSN
jgi:hypothetical protein